MAFDPFCTVNGNPTTYGVDVAPGATVSLALSTPLPVGQRWKISIIGTDELIVPPALSNVTPPNGIVTNPLNPVTFTFPIDPNGGHAIGIRSRVEEIATPTNGAEVSFGVYSVSTISGLRVGFIGELREGNSDYGWITKLNPILRTGGGGPENFSFRVVDVGQTIVIPTNQQMIVVGTMEVNGTLQVDGELVLGL